MDKNFMTVEQVKKTANAVLKKVRDKGYSTEGGGSGLVIEDVTNDKSYTVEIQLYNGKPRMIYEEVQ